MFLWLRELDVNILYYIQEHLRGEVLNRVVSVFTSLGNYGLIWILFTLGLLVYYDTRKIGVTCMVALLLDLIVCNGILKNIIARTRPYDAYENIRCIVTPQMDYSFPSGHTASSFAAVIPVLADKNTKRIGIAAFIVAVLMALSRLYVCVHYPSDVIGGAIVGVLCGVISCRLVQRYMKKNKIPQKNKKVVDK